MAIRSPSLKFNKMRLYYNMTINGKTVENYTVVMTIQAAEAKRLELLKRNEELEETIYYNFRLTEKCAFSQD